MTPIGAIAATAAGVATVLAVGGVRAVVAGGGVSLPGLRRTAAGARLQRSLDRAGIELVAEAFVAATLIAAALAAATIGAVLGSKPAALIAGVVCIGAAVGLIGSAERRYIARLSVQVPLIAQHIGGALGAGLSLRQAVERAHIELPEPAAGELRGLARELRLGVRVDVAFEALADRVADPGLQMMVTAILTQRTVGGNLAGALTRLAGHLDERARLVREVRTTTEQARMSAWMVAALPPLAGAAVELVAPGTLQRALGHGPGQMLLIVAVALEATGVVVIRRLVRSVTVGVTCRTR